EAAPERLLSAAEFRTDDQPTHLPAVIEHRSRIRENLQEQFLAKSQAVTHRNRPDGADDLPSHFECDGHAQLISFFSCSWNRGSTPRCALRSICPRNARTASKSRGLRRCRSSRSSA